MDSLGTSSGKIDKGNKCRVKRAGPYLLGTPIGNSPVPSITNCLARQDGTDKFRVIKILHVKDDSVDVKDGKVMLLTEYSILEYLTRLEIPGIVQEHGLFQVSNKELDEANQAVMHTLLDEAIDESGEKIKRFCLVLDCYVPHDFSPEYTHITNLHKLAELRRFSETEATNLFYGILTIVQRMHEQNVVHRDLKLANVILNTLTGELKLANFCLGKLLRDENELLMEQRGSPAYISPDVIKGKPYLGKPSDMWAMGVIFYTLLFCQFPFYDPCPSELYRKIKACEYTIPDPASFSSKSLEVVRGLLELDPEKRLTCEQALTKLGAVSVPTELQLVPEVGEDGKGSSSSQEASSSLNTGKSSSKLVITSFKEEARVLTYRELKKLYSAIQSKDGNLKKVLKRL